MSNSERGALKCLFAFMVGRPPSKILLHLLQINKMKNMVFLVFLHLGYGVYCQKTENFPFKYDSLVQIAINDQMVVYHKKSSGVYDLAQKKFVVPLGKEHIQFLENAGVLLKIEKNNVSLFPFQQPELFNPTTKREFKMFDYGVGYSDGVEIVAEDWILVNQFKRPIQSDMPLIDHFGEDSMSTDGNYVYSMPFAGAQHSGLFDTKSRKWLIAPKYASVHRVGNYFLAKMDLDANGQYVETPNFTFVDIYEKRGKQIHFVRKMNISDWEMDWSEVLHAALGAEKVERLAGAFDWYKIRQAGQEKVVRFGNNFGLDLEDFFPNTAFDFVVFHPKYQQLLAYNAGKILHYTFDEEIGEMILKNTESNYAGITTMEGELGFHKAKPEQRNEVVLSLEQIGTHLIVHQHTPEYHADYPLITEYGEDSIIISGDGYAILAYPEPEPGHYLSGVYDLSSKKWLIPQKHRFVIPVANNYLVQTFSLDAAGIVRGDVMHQKLLDKQGKELFTIDKTTTKDRDALVKKLFDGYSIQFAGMQNRPFEFLMDEESAQSLVYKMAIDEEQALVRVDFNPGLQLNALEVLKDSRAAFVDAYFDFSWQAEAVLSHRLKLNGNQVELTLAASVLGGEKQLQDALQFTALNFELTLHQSDNHNSKDESEQIYFLISVVESDNKTQKYYAFAAYNNLMKIEEISALVFSENLASQGFKKHTFKRQGDLLVVQKTPVLQDQQQEMIYDYDDEIITVETSFAAGNSAAYKKTEHRWKAITPLYAAMNDTPYGYLAAANFGAQHVTFLNPFSGFDTERTDTVNRKLLSTAPAFELLNANFEPYLWQGKKSFSFIEVFDFGYRIFTSANTSTSILISPTGQMISEEHYDMYFLEAGKIVGYSSALYDYDEFGDEVLDNEGRHVQLQVEKRKEFELKP